MARLCVWAVQRRGRKQTRRESEMPDRDSKSMQQKPGLCFGRLVPPAAFKRT